MASEWAVCGCGGLLELVWMWSVGLDVGMGAGGVYVWVRAKVWMRVWVWMGWVG